MSNTFKYFFSPTLMASLLLTSGCGLFVLPLPPPSTIYSDLVHVDKGETQVSSGVSVTVDSENSEMYPKATSNLLGGGSPLSITRGVSEKWSLRFTTSPHSFARLAAIQGDRLLFEGDKTELSWMIGGGAHYVADSYTVTEEVVDENGETVLDADGNPVTESNTQRRAYMGLIPHTGLRGAKSINDKWRLLGHIQTSYTRTFGFEGVDDIDLVHGLYGDVGVGLLLEPHDSIRLGGGLTWQGVYFPLSNENGFGKMPSVNISVGGKF